MCSVNTYDDYMIRRFPEEASRSSAADVLRKTTSSRRFSECIFSGRSISSVVAVGRVKQTKKKLSSLADLTRSTATTTTTIILLIIHHYIIISIYIIFTVILSPRILFVFQPPSQWRDSGKWWKKTFFLRGGPYSARLTKFFQERKSLGRKTRRNSTETVVEDGARVRRSRVSRTSTPRTAADVRARYISTGNWRLTGPDRPVPPSTLLPTIHA